MAPAALTSSQSFRLTTTTSRPRTNPKPRKLLVYAAKQEANGQSDNGPTKKAGPFFFDFNGKLPDAAKSLVPVVSSPTKSIFASTRRKDPNTVFVAGATGQAGVRIAQTLLRQGFAVRAGVPDLGAAQDLARLAAQYKFISPEESRRLNAVESAVGDDAESIAKAIGNASKVVVTIGPGENGPTGGVTTNDALEVVRAADLAGAAHVAVVFNSGVAGGFPGGVSSMNNVLDGVTSFFSNLFSPAQALSVSKFVTRVVETTEVKYTLIKAALTEDFAAESGYGIVVNKEGSGGSSTEAKDFKVSKSQIASLVAEVFSNTSIAENKVVEVCTNPSAPSKSIEELFGSIPEDGRRKAYKEAVAKAKAEEEALIASEKARDAAEAAKKLEVEVKKLSEQEALAASLAEEARQKAEAAGATLETLLNKAKSLGGDFSWQKIGAQLTSAVGQSEEDEEEPKVQIATIRGQAKARSLPPLKAVVKKPTPPPAPQPKARQAQQQQAEQKVEVRNVFGGLFKQETIYMDD